MSLTDPAISKMSEYGRSIKAIPIIGSLARTLANFSVDTLIQVKGWEYPEKFPWDWRLEMLLGRYEKETVDLFNRIILPGMTVIDIGAHVGYFTRLFSKLVGPDGRVVSFDANKNNFEILIRNASRSRYKNITLVNKAISDKDGSIDFYKVMSKTGCHSIIQPVAESEKVIVPSVTLDSFLTESGINKVDIIKIDIEGAEYYAFMGMKDLFKRAKSLYVLCEYCPKHLKLAGIDPIYFLKTMQGYGLSMYQVLAHGEQIIISLEDVPSLPFYEMGYTNILFVKN